MAAPSRKEQGKVCEIYASKTPVSRSKIRPSCSIVRLHVPPILCEVWAWGRLGSYFTGSGRGACSSSTRRLTANVPPLTARESLFRAPLGRPAGSPLSPERQGVPRCLHFCCSSLGFIGLPV